MEPELQLHLSFITLPGNLNHFSQSSSFNFNSFTPFIMSLKLPSAPNAGLFKQGYQNYQSDDGAVNRNIAAVREISSMVRTSIGPSGRNKIIVNHLGKIFLTSDAGTILRELDVIHPAAKLVVTASQQQEVEMGDASNFVLIFAGELLNKAEWLLRLGLSTSEIAQGYEIAKKYCIKCLEEQVVDKISDMKDAKQLQKAIQTAVASKQYANSETLAKLVSEAVAMVLPQNPKLFNVDNVRVVKIMGASLESSQVIKGMVFGREPDGTVHKTTGKSKVAVFTCPVDTSGTETKGTVLLHNAQEMMDYTRGEEQQIEAIIKDLHDAGIRVVIAGAGVGELALHYMNRYGILIFKVGSKFDLRRLALVCGASPLARLGTPMPEEMGSLDVVETIEIGGDRVTVFRQNDDSPTRTATIVVRGATQNALDDVERAIDDGVNAVKALTKDPSLVAGAGSTEIDLASKIVSHGEKTSGILQHAIKSYGESLEIIASTLAENAGLDAQEVLSRLYSAHNITKTEKSTIGVDVENNQGTGICDAVEAGIFDILSAKKSAVVLATDAATTVVSVDQIIMAKRAGGPAMPKQQSTGNWDQDD